MTAKVLKLNQSQTLKPSRALGKCGMALWKSITSEYRIEDAGGIEMLVLACQALDRAEACRAAIDADGECIRAKGGIRSHPLLRDELANRAFVTRTIARLGLDVEALKPVGRPPTPLGWRPEED